MSINADIIDNYHEEGGIIEDPRQRKRIASAMNRNQAGSNLDGITMTQKVDASQQLL